MVAGSNFKQQTQVQLMWDGSTRGMPTLTIGKQGGFTAIMVVPEVSPGSHTLAARAPSAGAPTAGPTALVDGPVLATETFTILSVDTLRSFGPNLDPNALEVVPTAAASDDQTPTSTDTPTFLPDPTSEAPSPTDPFDPSATAEPTTSATFGPFDTAGPDPTAEPSATPTAWPTINPTFGPTAPPAPTPTPFPTSGPTPPPTPNPTPGPTPTAIGPARKSPKRQ